MRRMIMTAAVTASCLLGGVSSMSNTARADDFGGSLISMQRAVMIANGIGLVSVNEIQFDDGKWDIEGRDPYGRSLTVDIDGRTGQIVRVDRW